MYEVGSGSKNTLPSCYQQIVVVIVNCNLGPTKHLRVHGNLLKRVCAFLMCVGFQGEGKTGVPGEKPLETKVRTNNKLNPHNGVEARI